MMTLVEGVSMMLSPTNLLATIYLVMLCLVSLAAVPLLIVTKVGA